MDFGERKNGNCSDSVRRTRTPRVGGIPFRRSEGIGGKVRQVTLLNLGADFSVPEEQWRELALLIETMLGGIEQPLEPAPNHRDVAQAGSGLPRTTSSERDLPHHEPSARPNIVPVKESAFPRRTANLGYARIAVCRVARGFRSRRAANAVAAGYCSGGGEKSACVAGAVADGGRIRQ